MALASAGGGGREVPQEEGGTHEESSGHFDEAQRRTRPRESAEEGQSVIEEEETAAGTPVTAQWLEGVRLKERLGSEGESGRGARSAGGELRENVLGRRSGGEWEALEANCIDV